MIWKLKNLVDFINSTTTNINGKWVPCRPMPAFGFYGFKLRLKAAWKVFIGRADAFEWPEGQ